jgi:NDP-sugar pyrophosphorylase family protein
MIDQTTVLILCGGLATRLQPITKTIPKSLVMINNKPMLQYQLDMLQKQGIRHVVLCVGYLGEMIKDTFGDKYEDILLEYSFDGSKQLGTGGAIKKTYSKLSDTFFVLYGDSYLPVEYKPILVVFLMFYEQAGPPIQQKRRFQQARLGFGKISFGEDL